MTDARTETTLRIGTRASALATTQARLVADAITSASGRPTTLVPVASHGDRDDGPLASIGGTGVFVTALRDALTARDVDLVVHSLKDLPTQPHLGLTLAAVPVREDPRDVLVARDGLTLGELPAGSQVGTGSPRRAAQLNALGLGLDVVDIRGNVDTRIAKLQAGQYDAIVLARAGLARLDRLAEVTETLDPLQMLPAPGQGALAVECLDPALATDLTDWLDDGPTRAAVTAERTLLAALEAGCTAPVGALAEHALGDEGDELWLRGFVGDPRGRTMIRLSATGSPTDPVGVGQRLAAEMLAGGAAELYQEAVS